MKIVSASTDRGLSIILDDKRVLHVCKPLLYLSSFSSSLLTQSETFDQYNEENPSCLKLQTD